MERLRGVVEGEWGDRLIRSWDEGWMDLAARVGDLVGTHLVGARPGEVVVADSTTVNLYKALGAALDARPGRTTIVIDRDDFPTDRYVVEGLAAAHGDGPKVMFDLSHKPLPEIPFPNDLATRPDPASPTGLRVNASLIALLFGAVWMYALSRSHLLSPDVDREAAMRAWPRFSVGTAVYLACIPLGQFSPIAVVVVCAALAIYYAFERLPDITHQPAAR